jgi:hypothetical protein
MINAPIEKKIDIPGLVLRTARMGVLGVLTGLQAPPDRPPHQAAGGV